MTLDIEDLSRQDGGVHSNGHPGTQARITLLSAVRRSNKCIDQVEPPGSNVPGTQTVWVKTFGCAHNVSDSEYMMGQLQAYGYKLVPDAERDAAQLWVINSCTVKSPSQSAMATLIAAGKSSGKALLVAGCVPQGDRKAAELKGLSLLGVGAIDRVVEAAEATLNGEQLVLLGKRKLPDLDLPKVRRNAHVEIVPLSTGCLGACTYCKTKHARGHLGSYRPEAIVSRVAAAAADPLVREIWLSSEDTGAYGRDIGTNIADLLQRCVAVLPEDGRTMLRLGMTNPPFILEHLDQIAEVLNHPCVFAYLHLPVQSGSDPVLLKMNREYTVEEFRRCADTLLSKVPDLELATDIIVGFPGESDDDWSGTMDLVDHYKFSHTHISQFYPRPGTPAARMKRVPTQIVKDRSRQLSRLVETFTGSCHQLLNTRQRVWVTDTAADGHHLVGHTKNYTQVLLDPVPGLLGCVVDVTITAATRWSVRGQLQQVVYSPAVGGPTKVSHLAAAAAAMVSAAARDMQDGSDASTIVVESASSSAEVSEASTESSAAAAAAAGSSDCCGGACSTAAAGASASSSSSKPVTDGSSACSCGSGTIGCQQSSCSSSSDKQQQQQQQQTAICAASSSTSCSGHTLAAEDTQQQTAAKPPSKVKNSSRSSSSSSSRTSGSLGLSFMLLLILVLLLLVGASAVGVWTFVLLLLHLGSSWPSIIAPAAAAAAAGSGGTAASECRLKWT